MFFKKKIDLTKVNSDIKTALIKGFKVAKNGTGKILVTFGSTTTDDEVISAFLKTAILAAEKSYLGSTPVTDEMLTTALTQAFKVINSGEVQIGTDLQK